MHHHFAGTSTASDPATGPASLSSSEQVVPIDMISSNHTVAIKARYLQTKEQSAELLRVVIDRIGKHNAPCNPITFTVWYEHIAGINPRLTKAIEQRLVDFGSIGDQDIADLYLKFIARIDLDAAQRLTVDLDRVMNGMAASADSTSQEADRYGAQLAELERMLQRSELVDIMLVGAALTGTRKIKDTVQSLQDSAISSRREIEKLRADVLRYRIEAVTDPLTQLLNRKGVDQRVEAALTKRPPTGKSHCLIMLDIDHFKRVNDTHGHLVGDAVLQGVSGILRRLTDAPDTSCARYGGEEFAILIEATTLGRAAKLAESVCTLVRAMTVRHRTARNLIANVTVSAGIAAWQLGDEAADLINSADAALYRSKAMGRDRVTTA